MRVYEVVTIKPRTPEQQRVASLQRNVEQARIALVRERERQRQQRSQRQIQRLQNPKPVNRA